MTDWTFHPTLVAPFYLHFMGGNIVTTTPASERLTVLTEFRARATEVNDTQLREMLASTWRPSIVAAWYIAYLKRTVLLTEVEKTLLMRPSHAQHLCICLARLGDASASSTLLAYLERCASGQLQINEHDESITPEWALCALGHLDSDKRESQGTLLWNAFLDNQKRSLGVGYWGRPGKELQLQSFMNSWANRLASSHQVFDELMVLFENELRED